MQVYLVGGAVRDQLLNFAVHDRDYVVLNSSPAQMLELGYVAVGREFPVFLHPSTREEYALARTERRTGKQHTDFATYYGGDVSLQQDLSRRDFTINAMAQAADGEIFDPFNGRADIATRTLRHIGSAFVDDPLRVLRLARFVATLSRPEREFNIASATLQLARNMVSAGELRYLGAERIWQECQRALAAPMPWLFYSTLQQLGALELVFAPASALDHGLMRMQQLRRCGCNSAVASFAALLGDCNSAQIKTLCAQLKTPREYLQTALIINSWLQLAVAPADSAQLLAALQQANAFRNPNSFMQLLTFLQALAPHTAALLALSFQASKQCSAADIDTNIQGAAIGVAIANLRRQKIDSALATR